MANDEDMDRFVHRILKASTGASITGPATARHAPAVQQLVKEIQHAKLLYFGEFHAEPRIVAFQAELVKEWARCLAPVNNADAPTRLHLIMEHFSVDMAPMLDRYQYQRVGESDSLMQSEDEAFEQLISSYKNDYGTEGHDLQPYRNLLQFCRQTTAHEQGSENASCEVRIHGGFIPRNHAARLNKECPDVDAKRLFFEEMSNQRGYLPKEGDAMQSALFEDESSYRLRGSPEHQLLIQSLMRGTDLYSPVEVEGHSSEDMHGAADEESPLSRLYQAQLLKDHAMGYRIAKLMLDHLNAGRSLSSDRYLVITGAGHLKHRLGVPDCVNGYLRQEALMHPGNQRRAAAMDLLLSMTCPPVDSAHSKFGGQGSATIGCQMLYEAYLEDSYPPMIELAKNESEEDDESDDADEYLKRKLLKDLYLQHPALLDEYIIKSQEISGPLLQYANGVAGFEHPSADYLYIYDDDDDNIIDQTDLEDVEKGKCPFSNATASDAKVETADAYERVGKTAGMRGNAARARAIMKQIGYTDEDIAYIGDDDIYNFQGVANPHSVAKICVGEAVLDIGSGLGIDSFLAMRDSGANQDYASSFVVGVDLAESEMKHATTRASARGYTVPEKCRFVHGDVENLDAAFSANNLQMGQYDVCISNGAFCLVGDKQKAFENVFRALKPGGRMAISTTTITSEHLDPSFEWPVCMRMFASLETLKPMCESIGFENVQIIDAGSPMEGMEILEDTEGDDGDGEQRFKIHGQYADQYSFLADRNMDELCKVVTIYGEKPAI
ncbi:hypothetical protein ACHAXT_007196 [Thalassiosira profunda]